MIHHIVKGFGVQMHRVDNAANLKKLLSSVTLTHLFVSEEEYGAAADVIEEIAEKVIVVVVANNDFKLPAGSRARIMEKPFYCFPVAAVLNTDYSTPVSDETLFCPNVHALTVDDEPMNLIVAKNILRRYGMTFDHIYFQKASPVIAVNCGNGTFGLLIRDSDRSSF